MTNLKRRSTVSKEIQSILDTLALVTRDVETELLHPGVRPAQDIVLPPWIDQPFNLISLLEMQKFSAHLFVSLAKALEAMTHLPAAAKTAGISAGAPVTNKDWAEYRQFLEVLLMGCEGISLKTSAVSIKKVTEEMDSSRPSYNRLHDLAQHLQAMIQSEMSTHLFLYVDDAPYYEDQQLFGQEVCDKFPEMIYDIQEAGKCFALNRYTACVFHLMRVMELAVQRFGKKLEIKLVDEKVWQNILDEVNKAIQNLKKTPEQKAKQVAYAEIAAHLFNVKVAWRNPVMHPKGQYDGEESRDIFNHVKAFVRHLEKIL